MNKVVKLTKNELTKQLKKRSIVIMLLIIMSFGIIIPVGSKLLSTIDTNKASAAHFEKGELINAKTDKEKVENILTDSQNKYIDIYSEAKIEPEDWREPAVQNFTTDYTTLLFLEAMEKGLSKEVILEYGMNYDLTFFEKVTVSKKGIEEGIKELKKRIEVEKDIILKGNYIEFLKIEINGRNEYLKNLIKEKEKLEKSSNENKEDLRMFERDIKRAKSELEILNYRLENKINFDKDNWKNNTLLNITKLNETLDRGALSEKEFRMESNMKMSYEDYVANYNDTKKELENEKSLDWYSLKNNIPQIQFNTDARTVVDFGYNIFVILSILVVILIGGGIVANEFAHGTIRLLVIRPIKRGKILFSKLLALLIIGFGIVFIGTLILGITSGILYGFGSYGQGILAIGSNGIVEESFIVFLLKSIMISSGSLVFMIALVFFISTVVKSASLAVLVGTGTYLGSLGVSVGLATVGATWIASTPIPYINESILNIVPFFREALTAYAGMKLNYTLGCTILLAISLVLVVISYVVFNKKDIKN